MRNRFFISGILLFALIGGAWGNVLAASFCPQMSRGQSCCLIEKTPESGTMHHAMGVMQMGDMQMGEVQLPQAMNYETEANVLAQPEAGCEHCMSHCQLLNGPNTLREADQTRSSEYVLTPVALTDPVSLAPLFALRVHSNQNAPPGVATSRHVLFNNFRI